MSSADSLSPAARALLPEEQGLYLEATEHKHFSADSLGSRFVELDSLAALLVEAERQRGSLSGDDREAIIARGAESDAFLSGCRYLLVETAGLLGMVDGASVAADTVVEVIRAKPGAPCSLVVDVAELTPTTEAVIVIGPNDPEQGMKPSTVEMVWTAHPGLPTRPAFSDDLAEGTRLTVKELRERLGRYPLLNARTGLELGRQLGLQQTAEREAGRAAVPSYTGAMDDLSETSQPTTIELDALDGESLIEVPLERPSLDGFEVDHDAQGGWPQYRAGHEFDHSAEEVADQDRVEADRHERGLDRD